MTAYTISLRYKLCIQIVHCAPENLLCSYFLQCLPVSTVSFVNVPRFSSSFSCVKSKTGSFIHKAWTKNRLMALERDVPGEMVRSLHSNVNYNRIKSTIIDNSKLTYIPSINLMNNKPAEATGGVEKREEASHFFMIHHSMNTLKNYMFIIFPRLLFKRKRTGHYDKTMSIFS